METIKYKGEEYKVHVIEDNGMFSKILASNGITTLQLVFWHYGYEDDGRIRPVDEIVVSRVILTWAEVKMLYAEQFKQEVARTVEVTLETVGNDDDCDLEAATITAFRVLGCAE